MSTKWEIRRNEKTSINKLEIHIIELKKAKKEYNKNKDNKKAQWMMFMNNPESKEVKTIMEENRGIKEAVVTVRKMSKEERMQRLEDLRLKAIIDEKSSYDTGLHKGIEIGEKNKKEEIIRSKKETIIKIIKSMLKADININIISEVTNLSIEEIEKIKNI